MPRAQFGRSIRARAAATTSRNCSGFFSTVQLVLSGGPAPVNVPDVVGLSLPYAESIIEAAGLKLGRVDRVTSGQEAEVVLSVRPPPGNGRPPGSRVELLVSTGQGGGP